MREFEFCWTTKIIFGRGSVSQLHSVVSSFGNSVLFVYGCNSIKTNGVYNDVLGKLSGLKVFELGGVASNPDVDLVRQGVEICKKNSVEVILAVGGGSVIDCAKMISVALYRPEDPWQLIKNRIDCSLSVPLIALVTLAGSGSEVNAEAVISNYATKEKLTYCSTSLYPKVSIIDADLFKTVPTKLWQSGVLDMFSHLLEQYFVTGSATVNDALIESLMHTIVNLNKSLKSSSIDDIVCEELIWCSALADSMVLSLGNEPSAYPLHTIEHEITNLFGIAHGEGMAMIIPAWLDFVKYAGEKCKIARLGRAVFAVDETDDDLCIEQTINRIVEFIYSLNLQPNLRSLSLSEEDVHCIANGAVRAEDLSAAFPPLTEKEVIQILKKAL